MRSLLAIVVLVGVVPVPAAAADPPTFTVGFADGSRVAGQPIVGWHGVQPQPQCNGRPLFDPGVPARWVVNEQLLSAPDPTGPCVEFICGDRIFGTVEGWQPGSTGAAVRRPPSLRVRLAVPIDQPQGAAATIDVTADFVTRVVWVPRSVGGVRPGTIRLADGREVPFRSLRWGADGVLALSADGTERFAFADLAELAMPAADAWDDYYRLVAELVPLPPARLAKVETVTGIVATGAVDPQRVIGDPNDARTWRHAIQPAWSLSPLWLPHAGIRRRVFFAAHEPPLTLFPPAAIRRTAAYGGSWSWRSDRNVQGGPLVANGSAGGWGFGVQARCELALPLPPMASGFRTAVALDQVVGAGGCVRTAVHLGAADANPVWQSPYLVGTRDPVDTGWIGLPRGDQRPRTVVLVADMAHDGRPAGSDPHDIRDAVDWLDPLLTLVPEEFAAVVATHIAATVTAWRDCDVEGVFAARVVVDPFRGGESPLLVRQVAARGDALVGRNLRITAEEPCVAVGVSRTGASPSRLEIRVDGRSLGVVDVPERVAGQPVRPFVVGLPEAVGQSVQVEVVPLATDDQSFVEWWVLGTVAAADPNSPVLPGTVGVVQGQPLAGLP